MKTEDSSPAESAIARQVERFIAAYEAGDAEGLLDTYSDDLVKARHGAPDERKAETARRLREVFSKFTGRVDVENIETLISGDLAVSRGTFVVILTPRGGGETKTLRRRFLEIWRNEGGTWRVLRTMDNSAE